MAEQGSEGFGDVMTHMEAEQLCEKLEGVSIEEYGSPKWSKLDETLSRLNIQAHVNAMTRSDEFIMDYLSTFDKMKVVIYELIVTEIWKQNVLPNMKDHVANLKSYKAYLSVYHEAVLMNLLEVCLYHRTAIETSENYILELIDYCYRKLSALLQDPKKKENKKPKTLDDYKNVTRIQEFQNQLDEIEYGLSMMSLSVLRFITDHIKSLNLYVMHHLLVETDILCLLVPLIEERPWLRKNDKGEREVFENQKWTIVPKEDYSKLPKLEAQVWIAIYNLFMEPECRKKYELNEYRKSNLLRLRKYLNEIILDQIPVLTHLARSLDELSILQVNTSLGSNPFIVQQMPEVRGQLLKNKDWKQIAEYQKTNYFVENEASRKEDMKKLSELYNFDLLQGLADGIKCANCKKEATKRCSKCKRVYYCSRECQVTHWKDHKKPCTEAVANEAKKKEEDEVKRKQADQPESSSTSEKKTVFIKEIGKETESTQDETSIGEGAKKDYDELD